MHERAKPWVPLIMEASYRPSGWLGIMCVPATFRAMLCPAPRPDVFSSRISVARRLGSRLYYEFTATALSDALAW